MNSGRHCGTNFECIALVLQGGGALGSYQAGVYQALAEADLHANWISGVSIGAINSALIAGNPPEERVERLRQFWEAVTSPPLGPFGVPYSAAFQIPDEGLRRVVNQTRAMGIALLGAPQFFEPRFPPPYTLQRQNPDTLSYYDVSPVRRTIEKLVDFDRINKAGEMRFSVGAVNVRTGNSVYFDSTTHVIGPSHILASGSLPPGFPATEIDGEYYWDGGIVSNTPLQWVLDDRPRRDTLAFQVDLWNAKGEIPHEMSQVEVRLKDIEYSSRTRAATDLYRRQYRLSIAFEKLMKDAPEKMRQSEEAKILAQETNYKVCNIVQLIYDCKPYEGITKDYEFSRRTMEEHWNAGHSDALRAISHKEILDKPSRAKGLRTFDFSQSRS